MDKNKHPSPGQDTIYECIRCLPDSYMKDKCTLLCCDICEQEEAVTDSYGKFVCQSCLEIAMDIAKMKDKEKSELS